MSFRAEKYLTYRESPWAARVPLLEEKSEADLQALFLEILHGGVHGLCFSMYEEGQKPGDVITIEQVRRRMAHIAPYMKWVRSFSCIEGNEHVPQVAREFGIKTLVGAWLGKDEDMNRQEIDSLIRMANDGLVDIAAVGNEVLYRQDLTEAQLLAYIREVRAAVPAHVQVGYVDAYYEFAEHPAVADACDVILANCYPYWEGTPFEHAIQHAQQMVQTALRAGNGKPMIITETGWPSQGEPLGGAVPSWEHALKYFIYTQLWAMDENIDMFYFSSYDESWKVGAEGTVGAYWGIWDGDGKLKFA